MNSPEDNRPLTVKLRQLAKWYNISYPYSHKVLLEAAEQIEKDAMKLEQALHRIQELENIIKEYNCSH